LLNANIDVRVAPPIGLSILEPADFGQRDMNRPQEKQHSVSLSFAAAASYYFELMF